MNSLLTEKELIRFTFRFIDVILNNVDTPKFKKKKAFNTVNNFARLRGLDIDDEIYTFRINDKSFVVAFYHNNVEPRNNISLSEYFFMDKNFSNDNKVIYIFVPLQERYYSYADNNLTKILYSILNMIGNYSLLDINYYNHDINTTIEHIIKYMILTVVLYFTLEDNLDTKREINNFLSNHYGSENCIYNKVVNNIYDDLFKNISTVVFQNDEENIIIQNYENIVDNILEYLDPHSSLKPGYYS